MKNILHSRLFKNTVILSTTILLIEIMFRILLDLNLIDWPLLRIGMSSMIIAYIVSLILNNFNNKKIIIITNISIVVIVTFYSLIQMGFYNYLGNYMSLNTSSQLGKVTDYIKDYFLSFSNYFYLILIPLALLIVYYVVGDKYWQENFKKYNISDYIYKVLILGIGCELYYSTVLIGFMQNQYQLVSNEKLFANPTIQNVAINQFGISSYGILDLKGLLIKPKETMNTVVANINNISTSRNIDSSKWLEITEAETNSTYAALNNYFISRPITQTNEYTGLFEGKNLIVIMLESVNWISNNPEYFPNLYKVYNEGWLFTNNYSPRNNCSTGNNEFSALTSLFSINNICSANVYKGNMYFESLFNLFKAKNYQISSYHNYTDYYYYRKEIHPNLGSTYYGVESLEIPYSNVYQEWPSDVELIEKSYDRFASSTPFMTYLTTVTTHQPYYRSSEYGDMYVNDFADLKVSIDVKRYMSKMKVLDQAIGTLLDKLEQDNLLKDTVIVMFGDHYPYGISNSKLQSMFDYDISKNSEVDRTPFVIYNSETEGRKIDLYTTYINILPTIANLFNLDYDPRYYMGEDLFNENYSNRAIFANGSWQSPYAFYDTTTGSLDYINNEYTYSSEELVRINQDIYNRLNYSSLAIKNNYFKYLDDLLNSRDLDNTIKTDKKTINKSS